MAIAHVKKRHCIVMLLLCVAFSFSSLSCKFFSKDSGPSIESLAPDFTLQDMSGKSYSLQQFRGKVVLLNFWASWCGPCRHEMPSLEALAQKFSQHDFVVFGVSLDHDGWSAIESFRKQVRFSFTVVLDQDSRVSDLYSVYGLPETFLIDKKGRIVAHYSGAQDFQRQVFVDAIQRALDRN